MAGSGGARVLRLPVRVTSQVFWVCRPPLLRTLARRYRVPSNMSNRPSPAIVRYIKSVYLDSFGNSARIRCRSTHLSPRQIHDTDLQNLSRVTLFCVPRGNTRRRLRKLGCLGHIARLYRRLELRCENPARSAVLRISAMIQRQDDAAERTHNRIVTLLCRHHALLRHRAVPAVPKSGVVKPGRYPAGNAQRSRPQPRGGAGVLFARSCRSTRSSWPMRASRLFPIRAEVAAFPGGFRDFLSMPAGTDFRKSQRDLHIGDMFSSPTCLQS